MLPLDHAARANWAVVDFFYVRNEGTKTQQIGSSRQRHTQDAIRVEVFRMKLETN
jgi:hypothetical protein